MSNKNCSDIINELTQLLTYDDRSPPLYHGHVGRVYVDDDAIIILRSYADPREGCNAERLQVMPKNGKVHLSGYDERGRSIKQDHPTIDMETALGRILAGAKVGHRRPDQFSKDVAAHPETNF